MARRIVRAPAVPEDWQGLDWYLLVVRSGHEIATAAALADDGRMGFCPVETVPVRANRASRRKPGTISRPFIAGLCLVGFVPGDACWGRVLGPARVRDEALADVLGAVCFNSVPHRIDRADMDWLIAHHGGEGASRSEEERQRRAHFLDGLVGGVVTIIDGIFRGYAGVAVSRSDGAFSVRISGDGAMARLVEHPVPVPEEWIGEAV